MATTRQQLLPLTPPRTDRPTRRVRRAARKPKENAQATRIGSRHVLADRVTGALSGSQAESPAESNVAPRPVGHPQVRWGSAVVARSGRDQRIQDAVWQPVAATPTRRRRDAEVRRGRRADSWVEPTLPSRAARAPLATVVAAPAALRRLEQVSSGQQVPVTGSEAAADGVRAGAAFAQSRIRHSFEVFGACMMIAAFLAIAMFA